MKKDELNEREYFGGKSKNYWHATDEHCDTDQTMNKDELSEREYIQSKKNYYWHVVDYYCNSDNTMNKDELDERVNILGKKNHYWHATDYYCNRINGSYMCDKNQDNSKCDVYHTEETGATEVIAPIDSNINATDNFKKVLELATREYINFHGDCDVMFLQGVSNGFNVKRDPKNITGINEMVIKNHNNYKNINDKERFLYSNLKHMYNQLEMIKNNPNYSVLKGPVTHFDSTSAICSRYNVIEVIMKNYTDILYSFEELGLTSSEIKYQKHFSLFILFPFIKWFINSNMPLSSDRIIKLFTEYYNDEIYFEEKLAELKSILDLKK